MRMWPPSFLTPVALGPAGLKKFLKKHAVGDTLAVMDSKLGNLIKEKLDIPCVYRCADWLCMACMASPGIQPRLGGTSASLDVLAGPHA